MVKPVGPTGEVPVAVKPDTTAAYGKYLVLSVGECAGCHTKRDLSGAFIGPHMAGGNEIEGYITPNLTNSPDGRIYNWTQEQFIERFRKGRLIPKSPMPWNSFKRTSDDELKAIYKYLKSIPAEKTQELASK